MNSFLALKGKMSDNPPRPTTRKPRSVLMTKRSSKITKKQASTASSIGTTKKTSLGGTTGGKKKASNSGAGHLARYNNRILSMNAPFNGSGYFQNFSDRSKREELMRSIERRNTMTSENSSVTSAVTGPGSKSVNLLAAKSQRRKGKFQEQMIDSSFQPQAVAMKLSTVQTSVSNRRDLFPPLSHLSGRIPPNKRKSSVQTIISKRPSGVVQHLANILRKNKGMRKGRKGTSGSGSNKPSAITRLPRGGVHVRTSMGAIQFGMPPETIKDVLSAGLELTTTYVIPKERFNLNLGVTCAEIEFPMFYSFFFQKKSVTLVSIFLSLSLPCS